MCLVCHRVQKNPNRPRWESNLGRRILRQILYHIAVKACFYSDVVECLPVDPAAQVRFPPRAAGIFLHPVTFGGQGGGSRLVFQMSQGAEKSQPPEVGIEPGPQDLQANTLPRRCKSRLLPQGSRSVLHTYTYYIFPCFKLIRPRI